MNKEITHFTKKSFDDFMQERNGVQFRSARDIEELFGYSGRTRFKKLVLKTYGILQELGENAENNILSIDKVHTLSTGGEKTIESYDFLLTRYACYILAQNGDSRKVEIANAQRYFAKQTRNWEIYKEMENDKLKIQTRDEIKEQNKKLFEEAQKHGVIDFANFYDAGYEGLYGMKNKDIVKYKNLGDDKLLDRSDVTELAANLFRITQTKDKLEKEEANGQKQAERIHFMVGGKIRQTIKDIGGTLPENIKPSHEHIDDVIKRTKQREKLLGIKKPIQEIEELNNDNVMIKELILDNSEKDIINLKLPDSLEKIRLLIDILNKNSGTDYIINVNNKEYHVSEKGMELLEPFK